MAVELGKLIDLAYLAAVQDELWRTWTEELVRATNSPGALFWVIDAERFDMCRNHLCFRDIDNDQINREYLSGPVNDDPQMHRVCEVKRNEIYLDTDHVDVTDLRTAEYLKWQQASVGSRHHITASVVIRDGLEAGVSLHRTAKQGPADGELQRQVGVLFPHLARALQLGFRHSQEIQESWWEGLLSQNDARILLDKSGRVIKATPAAESVFRRDDGLTVRGDQLSAAGASDADALRAAVVRACSPVSPEASSLTIGRCSGSPYRISIYPLIQRGGFLAPARASALACIFDPIASSRRLSYHQRLMFGLTNKESEIADLLLEGHSLESTAAVLEMQVATARAHLKSIFRKVGVNRQQDLLRLLMSLPSMRT